MAHAQNLKETICISWSVNFLAKDMNLIILSPDIGKYKDNLDSNFCMTTGLGEEKLLI